MLLYKIVIIQKINSILSLLSFSKQQKQKINESVKISLRRLAKAIQISPVSIDIFNGVNYTFHLTFPNEQTTLTVYNLIANNILPTFTFNLMQNAEENKSLFEFEGYQLFQNQLISTSFPQSDDQQFIRNKHDTISLAVKQFLNNETQVMSQEALERFMFDCNIVIDVSGIVAAGQQADQQNAQQNLGDEQMLTKEYLNDLINHFKESKKYFEEVDGANVKLLIDTEIDKFINSIANNNTQNQNTDNAVEGENQQQNTQPQQVTRQTRQEIIEQKMQEYWIQKRQPILNDIYAGGQGNIQLDVVDDNTVTATVTKYCKFMQSLIRYAKQNSIAFIQNYIQPYHLRDKSITVQDPSITPEFEQHYQENLQWWQNYYQQYCAQDPTLMEQQFQQLGPVNATLAQQGFCEILSPMWQSGNYETTANEQHQHYPNQPQPLQEVIANNISVKSICCKEAQTLNINRSDMQIAMKDEIIRMSLQQSDKFQIFGSYLGMEFQIQLQDQQQDISCGFNQEGNFVFPAGETREQINKIGEELNLAPHFVNVQLGTDISQQKVFCSEKQITTLIQRVQNLLLQNRQFKIAQLISDQQQLTQILQNLTYGDLYTDLSGKVIYNTQVSAAQSFNSDMTSQNSNESLIPDISTQYLKTLQNPQQISDIEKFSRNTCKLPQIFTQKFKNGLNPDAFNHFLSFDQQFISDMISEGQQLEQADQISVKDVIPYIIKLYISKQQENQLLDVISASDEFRSEFLPEIANILQKMLLKGDLQVWKLQKLLTQLQIPEYCWIYLIQQFNAATLFKEAFLQIIAHFTGKYVQARMRCLVRSLQEFGPQDFMQQENLWFMSEMDENTQQTAKQQILLQELKKNVTDILSQLLCTNSESSIYDEVKEFIEQLYYKQSYSKVKLIIDPQILFGYNLQTMQNGKETVQLKRQFLEEICRVCGIIINREDINFIDNFKQEDIVGFYTTIQVQNENESLQQLIFGETQASQVKHLLQNYHPELKEITLQDPTRCLRMQKEISTSYLLHQLEFIIQYRGQLHPDQNSINIICDLLDSLSKKPLTDQIMNLINVVILKVKASIQYQPICCKLQFYKTYINVLRQIQIQSPNIQKSNYKALFFEDTLQISHLQSQYQTLINIYLSETSIEYIRELIDLMEFYEITNQLPKALEISQRLIQLCETYYEGSDIYIEVSILSGRLQYKTDNFIKSIKNFEDAKQAIIQQIEVLDKDMEEINSKSNLLNGKMQGALPYEIQTLIKQQQKLIIQANDLKIRQQQLQLLQAAVDGLVSQSATRNGTADLYQKLLENSIKIVNKILPDSELLCDLMGQMADILISQNKLLDSTVYLNFIVQKQKNIKIDSEKKFQNFKKLIFYTVKAANKDVQKVYKQILTDIELNEVQVTEKDVVEVVRKIIINENPQLVISEWFLNVIQDANEQSYWKLMVLFSYINQCEIFVGDDVLVGAGCNIVDTQLQQSQQVIPPLRYNELLAYEQN